MKERSMKKVTGIAFAFLAVMMVFALSGCEMKNFTNKVNECVAKMEAALISEDVDSYEKSFAELTSLMADEKYAKIPADTLSSLNVRIKATEPTAKWLRFLKDIDTYVTQMETAISAGDKESYTKSATALKDLISSGYSKEELNKVPSALTSRVDAATPAELYRHMIGGGTYAGDTSVWFSGEGEVKEVHFADKNKKNYDFKLKQVFVFNLDGTGKAPFGFLYYNEELGGYIKFDLYAAEKKWYKNGKETDELIQFHKANGGRDPLPDIIATYKTPEEYIKSNPEDFQEFTWDVFGDVKKGYINIDTDSRQWKFDDPSVAIVYDEIVLTRQ